MLHAGGDGGRDYMQRLRATAGVSEFMTKTHEQLRLAEQEARTPPPPKRAPQGNAPTTKPSQLKHTVELWHSINAGGRGWEPGTGYCNCATRWPTHTFSLLRHRRQTNTRGGSGPRQRSPRRRVYLRKPRSPSAVAFGVCCTPRRRPNDRSGRARQTSFRNYRVAINKVAITMLR